MKPQATALTTRFLQRNPREEDDTDTTGALPRLRIPGDPVLAKPTVPVGAVKLDDPALNVMTDFLHVTPVTVDGQTPIDEALQHM